MPGGQKLAKKGGGRLGKGAALGCGSIEGPENLGLRHVDVSGDGEALWRSLGRW